MRKFIEKYFNGSIPENVRMFNLASFMSAVFALFFALLGILVKIKSVIIIYCTLVFLFCIVLFLLSQRFPEKTSMLTLIELILTNCIGYPLCLVASEVNNAEVPVYFLVGITFGLVLLKGKTRLVFTIVQFVIDIFTMYYAFLVRRPYDMYYRDISVSEYFRIEFAVLSVGILCGSLIVYRNYLVKMEILARENAGKQAERVSVAKDMFLVNVSHEIRTPLNAIIGTTDVLLESDVSNHIKENAFNISNSSHALLSITSDLLDFSRIDIDSFNIVEEKYDIAIMLNDVINLMSVRLLDSNVNFLVDINPDLPKFLTGDSGKIRQILVNMLSNAIKYTKEGYVSFRVNFNYDGPNYVVLHVEVEDTGIGIREDMLEKIFEPYARSGSSDTDHAIEGNGLGLALCKKMCMAMEGNIRVESTYGEGSVFYFDIAQKLKSPYTEGYCGFVKTGGHSVVYLIENDPELKRVGDILDRMDVENIQTKSPGDFITYCASGKHDFYILSSDSYERLKKDINESGVEWSKIVVISSVNYSYSGEPIECVLTKPVSCLNLSDMLNHNSNFMVRKQLYEGSFTIPDATILVIDDNLVNLDVAENIFKKYEANVIKAASGKEGLICLEQEKVDMIFLDYMMPDMDGIDTLKAIRKIGDKKIANVPVVALTANAVSGARDMFLSEGFNEYMAKPIEFEKIEKVLLEYLPGELIRFKI